MTSILKLLTASLTFAVAVAAADVQESFHANPALHSGGTLTVSNVNGSVEIAWDQESVDLQATKFASSQDLLNEMRIAVQSTGDSVSIRTIVPENQHHGRTGARLVLRVPRRVNLGDISSSNGEIRVRGTEGGTKLSTSNGAIRVDLAIGRLSADTSNGPIEATLRDPDPQQPVLLSTSNGRISLRVDAAHTPEIRANTSNASIEIHLPSSASARLEASTSSAGVSSDFEVATRTLSGHWLQGTIGTGGPLLKLDTSNGSIRLLRN